MFLGERLVPKDWFGVFLAAASVVHLGIKR
jgi:EamA domain-containing membrane protein RarD